MTTSIFFSIQGQHESHNGTAIVFDFVTTGINAAAEYFGWGKTNEIKRNCIGSQTLEDKTYKVFENYTDSGSNDYYYFAIEVIN